MTTEYLGNTQTQYSLMSGKEIILTEDELKELMENNPIVQDIEEENKKLISDLQRARSMTRYWNEEANEKDDKLFELEQEKRSLKEILDWASYRDIGISSNTLLFATTGKSVYGDSRDIPHDYSDFKRCLKLYNSVRRVKERFPEVAKAFPKWIPIVREWQKLVSLSATPDECYNYLRSLREECYECDGYEKVAEGHWSKKK